MSKALDRWPVVTWFDLWATQFDILLVWILAQTTWTHFSEKNQNVRPFIFFFGGGGALPELQNYRLTKLNDISENQAVLCLYEKYFKRVEFTMNQLITYEN